MFNVLKSGGIIMIPIIICGLLALFIIVERLYYFYFTKKADKALMDSVSVNMQNRDFFAIENACDRTGTPLADLIKTTINNRCLNEKDLREFVQTKMDSVVPKYEHFLTALGTIASISTLLGLLGTVTGNIKAFGVLSASGTMGDPSQLANAIAQALITTVGGLIVSIPSIIFNNYFNSQVNHKIRSMESFMTFLIFRILGKDVSNESK